MAIDHTLTWDVARVGGMLAYVLATASVVLGLLLSLKAASESWPRFITNELHRFVTLLALVFTVVHTVAVFVDPFTAFAPAEVLVPLVAHYRPLWIALGIVSGYLLVAVWASEYIRKRIGYAWWRRFHYAAFGVFVLATLHGLGTGSDSPAPWALVLYATAAGIVTALVVWRVARSRLSVTLARIAAVVPALGFTAVVAFAVVGPAQPGWNAVANGGNGSGASAAWLAAHPPAVLAVASLAPTTPFEVSVVADLVDDDVLRGTFDAGTDASGTLLLRAEDGAAAIELSFTDGWTCQGALSSANDDALGFVCQADDGASVQVSLGDLHRSGAEVVGLMAVRPG